MVQTKSNDSVPILIDFRTCNGSENFTIHKLHLPKIWIRRKVYFLSLTFLLNKILMECLCVKYKAFQSQNMYRTRAIISRGLYIFYPISKDHFFVFKEVFRKVYSRWHAYGKWKQNMNNIIFIQPELANSI